MLIRRMLGALAALLLMTLAVAPAAQAQWSPEVVTAERMTWTSNGDEIVGYRYRSGDAGKRPLVLIAHGFGGTQAMKLDAPARRFAAAGYDAITFDYRFWGESGGAPREMLDITSQLDDWKAALAMVRGLSDVDTDRIALWGTSFSAGHVLTLAAQDQNIAAVFAQAPHVNGLATTGALPAETVLPLTGVGFQDAFGSLFGAEPIYLPIAAPPGEYGLLTQPGVVEGYELVSSNTTFPNRMTARSLLQVPFYSPDAIAAFSPSPTWFGVAANDNLTPAAPAIALANQMGATLDIYDAGHFDFYEGAPLHEQVMSDQMAFLANAVEPGPR